jgi:hypothetical protein
MADKKPSATVETTTLPIAYAPPELICVYSDIAQIQVTQDDLRISFYQTMQPRVQPGEMPKAIPAECVGRIVLTERSARLLLHILQQGLDNYVATHQSAEKKE